MCECECVCKFVEHLMLANRKFLSRRERENQIIKVKNHSTPCCEYTHQIFMSNRLKIRWSRQKHCFFPCEHGQCTESFLKYWDIWLRFVVVAVVDFFSFAARNYYSRKKRRTHSREDIDSATNCRWILLFPPLCLSRCVCPIISILS